MKSILYFSTAFMNRMSYAYKFGVVSILFFLALSGVSYQLFVEMNKEITHTKNELAGLELLETQIEMRKALGHYISSVWAIDQARPVTMETPESLVDSFRRDIGISNQAIENTIEKSRDFVSIAGHKSAEQLEKLSDLWKTSAQLNPVGDAVTNINYTRERELIGLSNRVIRSASMGASLAQDSDPQIFLLAELITKSLPELVVSLEELRGTSMAALALGSRTTTDVITGLETGLDVIMNDTSAFTSMADSIMDLGQLTLQS